MDCTKDEFHQWWDSAVGKEVIKKLSQQRHELTEVLAGGETLSETFGLTGQLTSRVVGEIAGLDYFLSRGFLDFDD